MSTETEAIIPKTPEAGSATSTSKNALYHDSSQSPQNRLLQVMFVTLVVLMVVITVSLSIYQGLSSDKNGFMYFMLGVNLIGFGILEIIMIMFVRRGDLPRGKTWFLYVVGIAVILESIFTDVALFR